MIGVRWTIGDVSDRGFEALRLSILGACRVFGPAASYVVFVNTIDVDAARRRTGEVPRGIAWRDATQDVPPFLRAQFDRGIGEGVAWKLAPLRAFPRRYEISLDNECVLWDLPEPIRHALEDPAQAPCILAEDVRPSYGRFAAFCPTRALNAGIRGLPPGCDLEAALRTVLHMAAPTADRPDQLGSELDEQGLQVAAVALCGRLSTVALEEVTSCSPFHPHLAHRGRCGAHFVGINSRHIPWDYYGRPADECLAEHWDAHRPWVERLVRSAAPASAVRA